jgi:hypothetical protein
MGELTTRQADTRFAELICADPQWLREEFTALVSASFGAPPAWPRPPAPPRVPHRPPQGQRPARQHAARPASRRPVSVAAGLCRQRSPPARRA